ncbi:hypothetical protein EV363DRAFT_1461136 [Boletus edulis]|nr:hypothetical protein EV363DRAFT_1461136 [Boletus edulis]
MVVTHSTERWTRLRNPTRVVVEDTDYYGNEDIYIPPQESSDLGGYDLTTHDDNEQHHWRRLDSHGESILVVWTVQTKRNRTGSGESRKHAPRQFSEQGSRVHTPGYAPQVFVPVREIWQMSGGRAG